MAFCRMSNWTAAPLFLVALIVWQDPIAPALRSHRYHITRPGMAPGIPGDLHYQWRPRSGSVRQASRPPLTLRDAPALVADSDFIDSVPGAAANSAVQWFAFDPLHLHVDDCALSAASVTVDDLGRWQLTLRAEFPVASRAPFDPQSHIRRNELLVRVHWLADVPHAGGIPDRASSRPVVAQTEPLSFFVQRGAATTLRAEGRLRELQQHYDLLQCAEIEFYYRHGTARHDTPMPR